MCHPVLLDSSCPKGLMLAEFGGLEPFGVAGGGNDMQLGLETSDKIEENINSTEMVVCEQLDAEEQSIVH